LKYQQKSQGSYSDMFTQYTILDSASSTGMPCLRRKGCPRRSHLDP